MLSSSFSEREFRLKSKLVKGGWKQLEIIHRQYEVAQAWNDKDRIYDEFEIWARQKWTAKISVEIEKKSIKATINLIRFV